MCALRGKNVLKCQRALRAHVSSVLTCSRPNVPCLFTCQSVLYALTCSRAIML